MERVVEQIIDVQKKPQVMENIVKVPKITQQVEDTQYRQSAARENLKTGIQQRTSEQVANKRVQPTVNPVEVKQPKVFKMTTQRKHSHEQERSQVNKQVEGQDHLDESAVKENRPSKIKFNHVSMRTEIHQIRNP